MGAGRSTWPPPATSGGAWQDSSAVAHAEALPGALGLPLLCASVGLSRLQLALPDDKLLQSGFSNNCLKVLGLCGLIQVPCCGGQACFPRLPVQGGGEYISPGLGGWVWVSAPPLSSEMTLDPSFLHGKMETMSVPASQGCYEK